MCYIVFAALHALVKTIDDHSGFDTYAIKNGINTSAAVCGIYGFKEYKRGIEYHIITSLAIIMMLFDASAKDALLESTWAQCKSLRMTLHECSPDSKVIFEIIQSWYKHKLSLILSKMRQKVLENRHSSCYNIVNRLILCLPLWGLGRLPCCFGEHDQVFLRAVYLELCPFNACTSRSNECT